MVGTIRLMVALMVKAAELDIALDVRAFEELSLLSIKTNTTGYIYAKAKPPKNVVTDHPSKVRDWQRSYFYIRLDKRSFEDPPSSLRVEWSYDAVPHPSSSSCPRQVKEDVERIVGSGCESWDGFSSQRIGESLPFTMGAAWEYEVPGSHVERQAPLPIRVRPSRGGKSTTEVPSEGKPAVKSASVPVREKKTVKTPPKEKTAKIPMKEKMAKTSIKEKTAVTPAVKGETAAVASPQSKAAKRPAGDAPGRLVKGGLPQASMVRGQLTDEVVNNETPICAREGQATIVRSETGSLSLGPVVAAEKEKKATKRRSAESQGDDNAPSKRRRTESRPMECPPSEVLPREDEGVLQKEVVPEGHGPGSVGSSPETSLTLPEYSSGELAAGLDVIKFSYKSHGLLVNDMNACADLLRQVRPVSVKEMPAVEDLANPDLYRKMTRAGVAYAAYVNDVVVDYEESVAMLRAELEEARASDELLGQRETCVILRSENEELKVRVAELSAENTRLSARLAASEEEGSAAALRVGALERQLQRLGEEHAAAVEANERSIRAKYAAKVNRFEDYLQNQKVVSVKKLLYAQAKAVRSYLERLDRKGVRIPDSVLSSVRRDEEKFKTELGEVSVVELTPNDLALSPVADSGRRPA